MKQNIFLLLLSFFLVPSSIFAQGAAPFWEPLAGPPGAGGFLEMLPDSEIATQVGGQEYVYIKATNSWVPAGGNEGGTSARQSPGLPPHYGYVWVLNGDTLYSAYLDTVYFSDNNGKSWRLLGAFGKNLTSRNILNIFELPSSRVVIVDDSNSYFISSIIFHTIDTEHAPELPRIPWNVGDTLWVSTYYGNLFWSTNFGKSWTMLYGFHSPSPDFQAFVIFTPHLWFLEGNRQDTVFPYSVSDVSLAYSSDHGSTWTSMNSLTESSRPYFDGIDRDDRIYFTMNDSEYRSDDLGQTWTLILDPLQLRYVMSDGTLYSAGSIPNYDISTDHGATWVPMGLSGLLGAPISSMMTSSADWISTTDSVFSTHDNGYSWQALSWRYSPSDVGYLNARPDSNGVLMSNTTERIFPYDGQRMLCNYAQPGSGAPLPVGLGVITSGFQVWVLPNVWYFLGGEVITESADSGCSFQVLDTISSTPVLGIVETLNDTILAVSSSLIVKGFESYFGQKLTFDTLTLEAGAQPTGAITRDSTEAIYLAMNDGKLFVTKDGANTWQEFPSPATDSIAPVEHMASAPNGLLFAVDSNRVTGQTTTWEYDPAKQTWKNVTSGFKRAGFPNTAELTNIWYVNGYAYAGTWNMGLFRSINAVGPVSSVETAEHHTIFNLYPNPSSSSVTMTYPSFVKGTYRIVDITGREWARGTIPPNSGKVTLDVHNLPNGLYEVTVGAGGLVPAKLVVNH